MSRSDLKYWSWRETQERIAADKATYPAARDIHLQLADRCADTVWSLQEAELENSDVAHKAFESELVEGDGQSAEDSSNAVEDVHRL